MTDDRVALRSAVVARARELGFHRVGITTAAPPARYPAYLAWLEAGRHGEMAYMAADDHRAAREDLDRIATGARSVISVAMAYDHAEPSVDDNELRGRVARYARGRDYHGLLKERLYQLAEAIAELTGADVAARPCTDSAPLLERELGERAGLGFIGKNTMLITPGLGSYTVLGELLTAADIEPSEPSAPATQRCGGCTACLDACPTAAFPEPFVLDARRCISYLTIEHRGSIPRELRAAVADMVFGCDICQDVCPYNAAAPARTEPEVALCSRDLEHARPSLATLASLGSNQWKRYSEDSAIRRAGRVGLARNTAVALGNSGRWEAVGPLAHLLGSNDRLVVEHAAWALETIAVAAREAPAGSGRSPTIRSYRESDWRAIAEIHDLARVLELAESGLVEAFLTLEVTAAPEGLFDDDVLVAELDGEVRGFVASRDSDGGREVSWLYVHPSWQRCGIARALLAAAMPETCARFEVTALFGNGPALALYESLGFEIEEEISGRLEGNEAFAARGVRLVKSRSGFDTSGVEPGPDSTPPVSGDGK